MKASIALVAAIISGLFLTAGCGQDAAPPPPPLAPAEAPATFKQAFEKAQPDVRNDASKLAQSLASEKFSDAFAKIGGLSSRPDLSPSQREAVGRAQVTVMQKLREAAARGDPEAVQLLEVHAARK